ncbi:flavodoxin family protein [Lacrimispora sp.]|jgi:multimeric flavodoxin WrbA|uniref:flavodoxin family protein n=1 Tax=Lacrimispora sp. TaxID=2719234 RepID=UPI0028AA674C|nr:flavodoxin family protein [Lacrimispora sp.]
MKKNIFAFIGSRSSKKTTYGFAEKIIYGINKVIDIEYNIITLNDLCIKPCTGCRSCFKIGKCIQKDDLCVLKNQILASDLFILAAPVYMHGMPGEMKNIIDRLATWAHTLRLAGKNILIISTCDTNGHTTVVDNLHLMMLHMGGRVIGKYVGTNFIPDGIKTDADIILLEEIENKISIIVRNTLAKWNSKIVANKFNESLYDKYRNQQLYLINNNIKTGETDYWIKTGMIKYETYQDYLEMLLYKDTKCDDN